MHDLVIRNGTVVDGSGAAGRVADVAVTDGVITAVGDVGGERAARTIDAEGHIVSPGFVDVHTHMDAQLAWDPLGECSCFHGVTTAVMGNCGFTLAPVRSDARHLVVRNLERAEDIAAEAMAAGIDWSWETYPEYLDFVDRTPKGINYAGYVGHSALRTWAMGERAFTEDATEDDLALMVGQVEDSMRAGAVGFTTSISVNHETSDDRPVASRLSTRSEINALVGAMGRMGADRHLRAGPPPRPPIPEPGQAGVLHLLAGRAGGHDRGADHLRHAGLRVGGPPVAARSVELLDRINASGGRSWAQVHTRQFGVLLSFQTRLPFDNLPLWSELRSQSLDEQRAGPDRPVAAGEAGRRGRERRLRPGHRGRGPQARVAVGLAADRRPAALPLDRRAGGRAGSRPDGGLPRRGDRGRPARLLHPGRGQPGPGPRARADAPALRHPHLQRLRGPRQPDHGLVAADPHARPLGPGQGASSRSKRRSMP